MHRFAAFRAPVGSQEARRTLEALRDRLTTRGYELLLDRRGIVILLQTDMREAPFLRLSDDGGIVTGDLFRRGDPDDARMIAACREEEESWRTSEGADLVDRYWGSYVAILCDRERDRLIVLRDPSGAGRCFAMSEGEVRVFASDPDDVRDPGAIDQVRLAGFLAHPRLSLARTGYEGVVELAPGEARIVSRARERSSHIWSPLGRCVEHASSLHGVSIRAAIEQVASARTSRHSSVLHRLSGGLDSAIVLAALAHARREGGFELVCVNEFSASAPEGDERPLARAAARQFGVSLIELEFRPARFADVPQRQVRTYVPSLSVLRAGVDHFVAALCAFEGALLTSGQGGDHLFQRDRTLQLAGDAMRAGALDFDRAMAFAAMAGVSVWRIWAHALKFGLLRRPLPRAAYATHSNVAQNDLAGQAFAEAFDHPWLQGWRRAPCAEVLRALRLLEATHYFARSALDETFLNAPLLLSQPIMEACLAARPDVMAPGIERGLVRAAFADILPPDIGARTTKGESSRFFVAQLEAQWPRLRELLLGGMLAQQSALDRPALESIMSEGGVMDVAKAGELISCIAAEFWLRQDSPN